MSGQVTIVKALETDLQEILDLQKKAYIQEAEIYQEFSIPPLTQSYESLQKDFQESVILKAVIDENIVGSVRAYVDANQICQIGRLIVSPDVQNRGIGKLLMNAIEDEFKHVEVFELFTGYKSEKNLYLYQKLGYKAYKTQKITDKLSFVYLKKELM